ncbi:MAG TPA: hypothetical protein VGK87_04320 [Anaerolineae bacterium]|jgi:hypothetical protein
MPVRIHDYLTRAWLAIWQLKVQLGRGDADSSGSTLRTMGIVALVLLVVAILGVAVYGAASNTASVINSAKYNFK